MLSSQTVRSAWQLLLQSYLSCGLHAATMPTATSVEARVPGFREKSWRPRGYDSRRYSRNSGRSGSSGSRRSRRWTVKLRSSPSWWTTHTSSVIRRHAHNRRVKVVIEEFECEIKIKLLPPMNKNCHQNHASNTHHTRIRNWHQTGVKLVANRSKNSQFDVSFMWVWCVFLDVSLMRVWDFFPRFL